MRTCLQLKLFCSGRCLDQVSLQCGTEVFVVVRRSVSESLYCWREDVHDQVYLCNVSHVSHRINSHGAKMKHIFAMSDCELKPFHDAKMCIKCVFAMSDMSSTENRGRHDLLAPYCLSLSFVHLNGRCLWKAGFLFRLVNLAFCFFCCLLDEADAQLRSSMSACCLSGFCFLRGFSSLCSVDAPVQMVFI